MYVTYVGEIVSCSGFLFQGDMDSHIRPFFHKHHCAAKEIEYPRRMHCPSLEPATAEWKRHSLRKNNRIPALRLCKNEHFQLCRVIFGKSGSSSGFGPSQPPFTAVPAAWLTPHQSSLRGLN
jgi:hypothetical protein